MLSTYNLIELFPSNKILILETLFDINDKSLSIVIVVCEPIPECVEVLGFEQLDVWIDRFLKAKVDQVLVLLEAANA